MYRSGGRMAEICPRKQHKEAFSLHSKKCPVLIQPISVRVDKKCDCLENEKLVHIRRL